MDTCVAYINIYEVIQPLGVYRIMVIEDEVEQKSDGEMIWTYL